MTPTTFVVPCRPPRPLRRIAAALSLAALLLGGSAGCGRLATTTEISFNGSWTRTLTLHPGAGGPNTFTAEISSDSDKEDQAAKARAAAVAKTEAQVQAIKKQFVVPSGPGWAVTRQRDADAMTLVARSAAPLAPGSTLRQDVVVRGNVNGQPGRLVVNEVTVRPLGEGRIEYRETLRWQGKRPDDLPQPQPETVQALRKVLPVSVATDETALAATAVQMQSEMWRLLFGPGEPLLGQLIAHTDLAERRLRQRLGRTLIGTLETTFGARLTEAERRAAARKLVQSDLGGLLEKARLDKGSSGSAAAIGIGGGVGGKSDENNKDDESTLAALTFALKPPGRVLETNGEYDELTGEVFWTLYAQAAAVDDVVLSAVCEVDTTTSGSATAAASMPATRPQ